MMQIDVFFTRNDLERARIDGSVAVVIDVLRASCTLIQALFYGAGNIYVVGSPEEAFSLRDRLGSDALLCGERDGIIIPGFDMGNSPFEYTPEKIFRKTLIYASTNGSLTLLACEKADEILIGGFINLNALVDELMCAEKVALVCSGKLGRYSIEDTICAGMIIDRLIARGKKLVLKSDSALTAHWLFERYLTNPGEMLEKAEHPVYLTHELGFGEDVAFCTNIGTHDVVPRFKGGIVFA